MKDLISPRVQDTRNTILRLRLFTLLLDAIVIFVLSAIVFSLLEKEPLYALVPSVAYLFIRPIFVAATIKPVDHITWRYPYLNERLQTAYDNRKESNVIVDALLLDVSRKLDQMNTSSFFEKKEVSMRVFGVVVLLFVLLSVNFLHIQQMSLEMKDDLIKRVSGISSPTGGRDGETMDMGGGREWERGDYENKKETKKIGGMSGGSVPGFNEGPLEGSGGGAGEDDNKGIYGAPSSARLEGRDVKMEVHPEYGGEVEIRDVEGQAASKSFKMPEEIQSAGTPEQEPVEYEEIIKKYFEKLSQEEGK